MYDIVQYIILIQDCSSTGLFKNNAETFVCMVILVANKLYLVEPLKVLSNGMEGGGGERYHSIGL